MATKPNTVPRWVVERIDGTAPDRLIKTKTSAQALSHVAQDTHRVRKASGDDIEALAIKGVRSETVGAAAEPEAA